MKYVSYEKYKQHIESEGWVLDPTTYKEVYSPHAMKQLVFRKQGDKRMLLINVMGKDNTRPMQLTDIISSINYSDPRLGSFGYENVKVNFKQKFWKNLSKEF